MIQRPTRSKNRYSRYEERGSVEAPDVEKELERAFGDILNDTLYRPVVEALDALEDYVNANLRGAQTDTDRVIVQAQRLLLDKLRNIIITRLRKRESAAKEIHKGN